MLRHAPRHVAKSDGTWLHLILRGVAALAFPLSGPLAHGAEVAEPVARPHQQMQRQRMPCFRAGGSSEENTGRQSLPRLLIQTDADM